MIRKPINSPELIVQTKTTRNGKGVLKSSILRPNFQQIKNSTIAVYKTNYEESASISERTAAPSQAKGPTFGKRLSPIGRPSIYSKYSRTAGRPSARKTKQAYPNVLSL